MTWVVSGVTASVHPSDDPSQPRGMDLLPRPIWEDCVGGPAAGESAVARQA